MKINKLYLTLGVFVLLLAYFLITQSGNRGFNTIQLPKIAALGADDIRKIEISRTGEKLVLERKNNQWMITEPLQFVADKNRLDSLRQAIAALRVTDLISSRSNADADYGLTSKTAISLRIFTANKNLELTLGSTNSGHTHTFVKLPKDSRVYQVLGDLSATLTTPAQDWRSLQINDFTPDNARSLLIVKRGKTLVNASKIEEAQSQAAAKGVTQPAAPARVIWKAEGASAPLNDGKISQVLGSFGRLNAAKISDVVPAPGKLVATVTVKTVGPEESLEFLEYLTKDKRYLVRKPGSSTVYELDEYQAQAILKELKDLI